MGGFSLALILLIAVKVSGQQSQFNCKQRLLFTPMDVRLCCKIPIVRLDKYRDQCYSKTFIGGITKKIEDNYSFRNPCAVECVFKRAGALENNNQLNMSNINALIRSNVPDNPELVQVLHLGFEKCGKEILNKIQEFELNRISIGKSKSNGYQELKIPCSPFAVLVTYCALKHAFINCPENSWISTEVCSNARNYVKNCGPVKFGGSGTRYHGRHYRKMETTTSKIKSSNI